MGCGILVMVYSMRDGAKGPDQNKQYSHDQHAHYSLKRYLVKHKVACLSY